MDLVRGLEVKTSFGWGRIERVLPDKRLVVALDWSYATVRPKATLYTNQNDIIESSFCSVGTCILTRVGTGVLLEYDRSRCCHIVRLWSPYSGAGSATAFMQKQEIIRVIKAAVGFQVSTPFGNGTVLHYRPIDDVYIVRLNYGIAYLSSSNVRCKQSKFLPATKLLLDKLAARSFAASVGSHVPPLSGKISAADWIANTITYFSSSQLDLQALASSATSAVGLNSGVSDEDILSLKEAFMKKAREHLAQVNIQQYVQSAAARLGMVLPEGSTSATIESAVASLTTAAASENPLQVLLPTGETSGSSEVLLTWLKSNIPEQYKSAFDAAANAISFKDGLSLRSYLSVASMEKLVVELVMRLWSLYQRVGSEGSKLVDDVTAVAGTLNTTSITALRGQLMSADIFKVSVDTFFEDPKTADFEALELVEMLESTASSGVGAVLSPRTMIAALASALASNSYIQGLNMEPFSNFLQQFTGSSLSGANLEALLVSFASSISLGQTGMSAQNLMTTATDTVKSVVESLKDAPTVQKAIGKLQAFDINSVITTSIKDPEALLSMAEKTLMDEEARNAMIAQISDQVTDFLLELMPSLTIPDMEGIQDDIQYAIGGLDLSGLAFKKDGVSVTMAGVGDIASICEYIGGVDASSGTPNIPYQFLSFEANGISAKFTGIRWSYAQTYFPHLKGDGSADASIENATLKLGFRLVRMPRGATEALTEFRQIFNPALSVDFAGGSTSKPTTTSGSSTAAATTTSTLPTAAEIAAMNAAQARVAAQLFSRFPLLRESLIASVEQNAELDDDVEKPSAKKKKSKSKSSSSMPSLRPSVKGVLRWSPSPAQNLGGEASVGASNQPLEEVEPVLVLSSPEVIRGYVVSSIIDSLTTGSGSLIGAVNAFAVQYWPQIEAMLKIKTSALPEASCADLYSVLGPEAYAGLLEEALTSTSYTDATLQFPTPGSLGLRIEVRSSPQAAVTVSGSNKNNTEETKSFVAVLGYVPGSQAERVFLNTKLQLGGGRAQADSARIKAVNGQDVTALTADDVINLMKTTQRPLSLTLSVPQGARKRMSKFLKMLARYKRSAAPTTSALKKSQVVAAGPETRVVGSLRSGSVTRKLQALRLVFQAGQLGLKLRDTKSCGGAVIVTGFARGSNGEVLQAEGKGCLSCGMIMLAVAGEVMFGRPFDEVMQKIQAVGRPLEMIFVPSPDSQIQLEKYPDDLMLANIENYIMVTSVGDATAAIVSTASSSTALGTADGTMDETSSSNTEQTKTGETAAVFSAPELKPGMAIIQVARTIITGREHTAAQVVSLIEQNVPTKIAIRDIDAFMHLIHIRDGKEQMDTTVEYLVDDVAAASPISSEQA